jgi:hypothetical protein
MGYACFTDDGNQAAIIVTNLENGDTLGVCPDHLVDYALGLLQSVTDLQWMPVTDESTGPAADDPTDDDEPAEGPTAAPPATEPAPGVVTVPLPEYGDDLDPDEQDEITDELERRQAEQDRAEAAARA